MNARPAVRFAVVALLAAVLAGCSLTREPQARSAPAPVTAAPAGAGAQAPPAGNIPGIVRKVEPSVVTISHDQGTGSGVVWSRDGVVVTNDHVVGGARDVEVAFFDGRRADGRVRATDPDTDLAVVDVERKDLEPATFQEQLPAVGELAVAVGSPLGFQNTVTAGIISGVHREIPGSAQQDIRSLVDLIQTDAAISPGNSGGALSTAAARWSASTWPTSRPSRGRSPSASPFPAPPPSTWSASCSRTAGRPTPTLASSPTRSPPRSPPSSAWTGPAACSSARSSRAARPSGPACAPGT
jgi:S1-C subfamily serine protease